MTPSPNEDGINVLLLEASLWRPLLHSPGVGYSRCKRRGRYPSILAERSIPLPKRRISMSAPLSGDLAQIGKSVVVKGELSGSEDLYVDGQVEGSIALKNFSLTVGPNGQVKASVEA